MLPTNYTKNTAPVHAHLVSGQGARVSDVGGNEYIDFCSQTLNINLGQCHPVIQAAVSEQLGKLTYASSRFSSDIADRLHAKLVAITPSPLARVNLSSVTGSLANECAIKAVRKKTGKSTTISRMHSHLGQSAESMRISGKHWENTYLGERNTKYLPAPYCFRCPFGQTANSCNSECLDGLEGILRDSGDDINCIIMEPVMMDAGVLAPPKAYHERVRQFCDEHHIPLIWDEIQTAFGWLGTTFAMDVYGVVPDILSLGKGLGAGLPIAATIMTEEYDVLAYGEHEFTSGANVLSCAASLAMIDYLETSDILPAVVRKGAWLRGALEKLSEKHPCIGDVRGIGLMLGIEIVDPKTGAPDGEKALGIFREMLSHGVILRISKVGEHSNVLQLKPPLVITEDDLVEVVDKLDLVLSN
ncbi:MAG: aspartate aminotransferase family protein [Phenylobacterium sp.]|uniref:aspartate aminotransferase family protein n=1 Tax=Phenylobacterium sp. TaxID=1871053 RepID=UPI00273482EB|nr:aspartate aminotransferase family protein [Phenylobacterium sp.]MDP3745643.1 aspartate aminotransferase family protein [Phenylobacterium sp.]